MLRNFNDFRDLRLPNTLELTPDHTSKVVGRLLRDHYREVVEEGVPKRLQTLIDDIDSQERVAMRASTK